MTTTPDRLDHLEQLVAQLTADVAALAQQVTAVSAEVGLVARAAAGDPGATQTLIRRGTRR